MTTTAEDNVTRSADAADIEAFEARLTNALNEAGVMLMMSIGHRLGLFDAVLPLGPELPERLTEGIAVHDQAQPLALLRGIRQSLKPGGVYLAQGGEGLGTMWGRETARQYFERAGFGDVEVHQLPHDIQNDYWVLRP